MPWLNTRLAEACTTGEPLNDVHANDDGSGRNASGNKMVFADL